MTTDITFRWSDAWLLAAIHGAALHGEPTLMHIIAMGDAFNHAIFTLAELNGGLSRLSRGGLITIDDGVYPLTAAGRELTRIDSPQRKARGDQVDYLKKRLRALEWTPQDDPNDADEGTTVVTADQLDIAFEAYRSELKRRT